MTTPARISDFGFRISNFSSMPREGENVVWKNSKLKTQNSKLR